MNKPKNQSLVPLVLTGFFVFAMVKKFVSPLVPLSARNSLSTAASPYVRRGAHQPIQWYRLTVAPFQAARQSTKPILLAIGEPWSNAALQFDNLVDSSEVLARLLASSFICVRIDATDSPDWAAAFLPYTRATIGSDSDFQLVVLSDKGKYISTIQVPPISSSFEEKTILTKFGDALDEFDAHFEAQQNPDYQPPGTQQLNDLHLVDGQSPPISNPAEYATAMFNDPSAINGGITIQDRRPLYISPYRLALDALGPDATETIFAPLFHSPTLDWLRGGTFEGSSDTTWFKPVYGKSAKVCAEMCLFLSDLYSLTGKETYRYAAEKALRNLLVDFNSPGNLISSAVVPEMPDSLNRVKSNCFTPADLRTLFPNPTDRAQVWRLWGLDDNQNPQMVPYLPDSVPVGGLTGADTVLQKLLKSVPAPEYDRENFADVQGMVTGNCIRAATILGDNELLLQAANAYDALQEFVSGDDVIHNLDSPNGRRLLFDYIGVASASLQNFIAFGNLESLQLGFRILKRANFLFAGKVSGEFLCSVEDELHQRAPNSNVPELVDNAGESALAQLMRLNDTYGLIFNQSQLSSERQSANKLYQSAFEILQRYVSLAYSLGPRAAGFIRATQQVQRSQVVICVGANPVGMVHDFVELRPTVTAIPAVGTVCPSLQRLKTGYYLISNNQIGPVRTLNEVLQVLNSG